MKIPFDDLSIRRQRRTRRKHSHNLRHHGIDTETYMGKAFLIADDTGRYLEVGDMDDVVWFLTHKHFRGSYNWFFNLRFDYEAIAKLLTKSELETLHTTGEIEYDKYRLSYLDRKMIILRDKKNKYAFYDINNFLETSLDNAAKKYLNSHKIEDIDRARINVDKDYYLDNREKIIEYCIHDAWLTKEVAEWFWSMFRQKLNFMPNKPFSKGRLSEEYFLKYCYIPMINNLPYDALRYAYNSYFGGRFELLQRGFFDNVNIYDIRSAYPAIIASLLDITKGKWLKTDSFLDNADYGFYRCNVIIYDRIISPIIRQISSLNIYPNGIFSNIFLTQNEVKFIERQYSNVELEVLDGWVFIAHKYMYPFKKEILKLYEWKETEKDENIRYMVKIVLNSLYGKFIQKVNNYTGNLFNPIYASICTSETRLKLLNFAFNYGKDSVIGFSTDSVQTERRVSLPESEQGLGGFKHEFAGKGIFIMSDIYEVWNNEKRKLKFRGFKKFEHTAEFSLLEELENLETTELSFIYKRPIHIGEALACVNKYSIDDINLFKELDKILNVNGDRKRIWEKNFESGSDVLHSRHSSEPLALTGEIT